MVESACWLQIKFIKQQKKNEWTKGRTKEKEEKRKQKHTRGKKKIEDTNNGNYGSNINKSNEQRWKEKKSKENKSGQQSNDTQKRETVNDIDK